MLINPKIDWTIEDYYNAGDLNRVESNTQYIAEYIRNISYNIPGLNIITDRDIHSIDFLNSINRVEGNLAKLRKLHNSTWLFRP